MVLPPGEILDLGTIHLSKRIEQKGLVLDRDGKPVVGASLTFYDLDRSYGEQAGSPMSQTTDSDGRFAVWLGHHRYSVRVSAKDSPLVVAGIDLRGGQAGDLEIRLRAGARVRADPEGVDPPYSLTVLDEEGRVVTSRMCDVRWPLSTYLAAGSYVLVVRGPDGAERRTPFTVGSEPVELR